MESVKDVIEHTVGMSAIKKHQKLLSESKSYANDFFGVIHNLAKAEKKELAKLGLTI